MKLHRTPAEQSGTAPAVLALWAETISGGDRQHREDGGGPTGLREGDEERDFETHIQAARESRIRPPG